MGYCCCFFKKNQTWLYRLPGSPHVHMHTMHAIILMNKGSTICLSMWSSWFSEKAWQSISYLNTSDLFDLHLSSGNICYSNICHLSSLVEVPPDFRRWLSPVLLTGIWNVSHLPLVILWDFIYLFLNPVFLGIRDYLLRAEMILLKAPWWRGRVGGMGEGRGGSPEDAQGFICCRAGE